MMNVVAVMGRLTSTPELKQTPNGLAVTSFTIACERSYQKKGEQKQVDFIECVAWRNNAEFICKYFEKGQLMALNGSLQTRNYEDKNGNKRKAVEILVEQAHFAEGKRQSEPTVDTDQEATLIDETEDLPF